MTLNKPLPALLGFVLVLCLSPGAEIMADDIDDILSAETDVALADVEEQVESVVASRQDSGGQSGEMARLQEELLAAHHKLRMAREEVETLKTLLKQQADRHGAELLFAHYNMGCVYKASRQYQRAESEFLKALAIDPNDASTHYNLGILYDDDLEQKDKARHHYQRFLALSPDDRDVASVQEWLAALDD